MQTDPDGPAHEDGWPLLFLRSLRTQLSGAEHIAPDDVVGLIDQPDVRPQLHSELISPLLVTRFQGMEGKTSCSIKGEATPLEFLQVSCLQ